MSWLPKEQSSSLDKAEISGLYFLDGDFLASALTVEWTKDQMYPMIQFPSGLPYELWESGEPSNPIVHLFGEMDLLYQSNRDSAYTQAMDIAEQVRYAVYKVWDNHLELCGDEGHLLVTYDNEAGPITNVEKISVIGLQLANQNRHFQGMTL